MHSVSSRIWTRVAVSISYDDNHYTTFKYVLVRDMSFCVLVSEHIDFHRKLLRINLCFEFRESRSFYVHLYIFVQLLKVVFFFHFMHMVLSKSKEIYYILNKSTWPVDGIQKDTTVRIDQGVMAMKVYFTRKIISVVIDYVNYFIDNSLNQLYHHLVRWNCELVTNLCL